MSALKGDFISFSFNGVHSSELGIIRTSDGSRFNENLLPTIQDKTVQVPGGDGTYFFGSYYTQRQFNMPIAFDSLTEEQVRRLYSHFGDKQIHELIFDERPYKYYMAKINGTPQIKTICFEVEGQRVYKGEGTLNFICYYPFAKSRFKYLDEYTLDSIPEWNNWPGNTIEGDLYNPRVIDVAARGNLDEWAKSSGLLNSNYSKIPEGKTKIRFDYPIYNNKWGNTEIYGPNEIYVYNPGDMEADFKLYFRFPITATFTSEDNLEAGDFTGKYKVNGDSPKIELSIKEFDIENNAINNTLSVLKINSFSAKPGYNGYKDNFFCINTKTNLIEGGWAKVKLYGSSDNLKGYYDIPLDKPEVIHWSGNVYNNFITSGDFFKIPPNKKGYYAISTGTTGQKGVRGFESEYIYF